MRVLNLLFAVSAFAGTVAGAPHLRRRLQTSDADVPIDPGNLDPANIDPSTLTGPVIPDVDPDSVGNLDGPATGPDDSSGPVENSDVGVDVGGGDSDFNGDTPDAPGPADPDQGSGDDSEPEDPPPPHGDQSGQVTAPPDPANVGGPAYVEPAGPGDDDDDADAPIDGSGPDSSFPAGPDGDAPTGPSGPADQFIPLPGDEPSFSADPEDLDDGPPPPVIDDLTGNPDEIAALAPHP